MGAGVTYLMILGGLVLLALGGEAVVRGAVGVARRIGVSELMIGLTLVGFGTSAPELATSVFAALRGSDGVAVGNVVGSNISNILLIAALAAVLKPMAVPRIAVFRDGSTMIGASLALAVYAFFYASLERWTGAVLVLMLVAYVWSTWRLERRNGRPSAALHKAEGHTHDPPPPGLMLSLAFAIGGIAILVLGADWLVRGAVVLAEQAGLSETVIGLTIVAVGTSLPELAATLASALRGRSDVAFGNVVGSNIYNILGVLGITALTRPIALPDDLTPVDWGVFLGSAVLLVIHAWSGAKISRGEGALLLLGFVLYVTYLIVRTTSA
jgi:cation:H+ antiporter